LNLVEAGYSKPTPVQIFTIPMILMRRDVLVCAPTGSGKSELLHRNTKDIVQLEVGGGGRGGSFRVSAVVSQLKFLLGKNGLYCVSFSLFLSALSFLLPLICVLVMRSKPSERSSPRILILAPTRELAMQIENQAKQLMAGTCVVKVTSRTDK
jgi:hypothetical protein